MDPSGFSLKNMGETISPSSWDDFLMIPFANSFLISDATAAMSLLANWFGL